MVRSIDGGLTFKQVKGVHHGDFHDIWIDPRNPQRMIASHDGGVDVTHNGGDTWHWPALPISQFYHVAADNRTPYHVSGTVQDFGTAAGPSNSLSSGSIAPGEWYGVGGGETGFTAPNPADPNIVFAGEYGGIITRYDHRTRQARNVSIYPTNPSGHGAEDLRFRFQWTAPILVSPHDPRTLYHGANVLFKSTDEGQHWTPISADLTRNDKSRQKWSGGPITGDNTGVEYYGTIFAIAESPKQKDLLWVGSDDGLIHVSRDAGKSWINVTPNIPGAPELGTVNAIEASPFEAGTAYLVLDAHRLDNNRPYLYKTADFGMTWKPLAGKLPQDIYLHVVREDPQRKGMLYLGTERGISFSTDDGESWKEMKLNLPTVAVHDLVVKNNDLVVGTHGRSIWIFDDLTPIREMSQAIAKSTLHLFPPVSAIRYRYHATFPPKGVGKNPAPGGVVSYYLKKKPKGDVTLEVVDAQGALVARLDSKSDPDAVKEDDPDAPEDAHKKTILTAEEGLNRVTWDLRYQGAEKIKGAKIDAGEPASGPLVKPGHYSLKLTADGHSVSAPLEVLPDPRCPMSGSDADEQLRLALTLRDQITKVTRMVNRIRSIKQQLAARNDLLKDNPGAKAIIQEGTELAKKLDDLEAHLHNPKAEVVYDILAHRGGAKLYSVLSPLYEWVRDGDGVPTQGMLEVCADCARELNLYEKDLNAFCDGKLARLNETARKLDVPNIIAPSDREPAGKP
jgi:photosystem II stability/assembly factor-like uncharacterized protein